MKLNSLNLTATDADLQRLIDAETSSIESVAALKGFITPDGLKITGHWGMVPFTLIWSVVVTDGAIVLSLDKVHLVGIPLPWTLVRDWIMQEMARQLHGEPALRVVGNQLVIDALAFLDGYAISLVVPECTIEFGEGVATLKAGILTEEL